MTKRFTSLAILLLVSLSFAVAQTARYQVTKTGVDIDFDDTFQTAIEQKISLTPISEQIIHVRVTQGPRVERNEDFITVDTLRKKAVEWTTEEEADTLKIKTRYLNANVCLTTGVIVFKDQFGKELVTERKRSSHSFIANSYQGDAFYKITQGFEIDENEGLYGLGQHQSGVMNYRGRQVTLLQYNTEVAVPFLTSNQNYGILWNNYSITKAGDVRPLEPLSSLKLTSADGQEGWLTANYFHKDSLDKVVLSRPESQINYLYLSDQHKFPKEINLQDAFVRYEGSIESPYEGLHRLHFNYAGYLKVWINGELVEDRWRASWNAGSFEIDIDMTSGEKYPIRMEWTPAGGESYLGLKIQKPIPASLKNTFSFRSEAGDAIDYYVISGDNMDDVISGYRSLTGRAPIMPKWSFGFWQSRERYKTQKELLDAAAEFRKREIPIDNMVQDWSYWKEHDWGSHDFDEERFPDPKGMIEKLHQDHFRLMISVWPKINEESSVYPYFRDKGWLYSRNIADARKDWIGKGYTSTFYDPFNPEARKGFWDLMNEKLYSIGVDAWWMDASEPDMHSNINMEARKAVMQPAIGSSVRYYNAFPLLNAKGIYEGQRAVDPNNRVFILTRSSFAGQQRYASATWSGDIASRWHDMRDQISAGINFSMSGVPYWTMDAGGFLVEDRYYEPARADLEEWREMNTRWYQYGAFLPMFRAHGQFPYREPFNIAPKGHAAYESIVYYIKLRYRFLPYNYSIAAATYYDNYSMIRGLAMDYGDDEKTLNIDDQYMFGPSLLVNPVTEKGKVSRSVYLPHGSWYNFYDGSYFEGGKDVEADAPYERIPLFVRGGSIIPLGPELQYTGEKPASEIDLYVYAGADANFVLYEDDGLTYDYEKGESIQISLDYNDAAKTLTIGQKKGSFKGMLKGRTFNIIYVSPQTASGYDDEKKINQKVRYRGKEIVVDL
ncbi:glycoside hydrolase family 31 protein [Albibacterium profundi]|uniref:TIM-barrel domain-containing protein n=1 Tax=Albibacterium profundi TaxID=3134906 RepID=A0ABV5CBY6_9SPHI